MPRAVAPRPVLAVAALAALLLTGCAAGPDDPPAAPGSPDVTALHENRTVHVGDASRVSTLVRSLGLDAFGASTIALTTDERPYAVTVELASQPDDLTPESADALLADRAALLLATVDNVDEVRWDVAGRTGSVTRADADTAAGGPVTELGADADGLRDLVERLEG